MAHYAYLDENNIVVAVIVGKDESELIDGLDTETYYALNTPYTVKRTSYNSTIRGNYAALGFSYLEDVDLFMPPKCHDEATLNSETASWECSNEEHNREVVA